MKYQKAFALFLAVLLFAGSLGNPIHNVTVYAQEEKKAEENNTMDITAQSAVLIENSSGRILYEKEKDKYGGVAVRAGQRRDAVLCIRTR